MNYILFDEARDNLLPFTHTRPVADIRCGILTMRQRWEMCLEKKTGSLTAAYLQKVYPALAGADNVYINGAVFGNSSLCHAIGTLHPGETLASGGRIIAARITDNKAGIDGLHPAFSGLPTKEYAGEAYAINHVWDVFAHNDRAIREDYALLVNGRKSMPVPAGVTVLGGNNLFIEHGAEIGAGSVINAATGPVYIGKDAQVLEGTLIRGPLAVCEHAVIKMGAKIYGATTIGPGCKVGGEINNAVFFANSNKSHDGYLGNAVIGEWCNLGADTNCSNLKNNYDGVKIWSEAARKYVPTGLTFCGLMMGDHSKCGINTMFNTGTVVGVSCNIFGGDFPARYVPSFSWGGGGGFDVYDFDKAMETAGRMMGRRNMQLSADERDMYRHIYNNAAAIHTGAPATDNN